MIGKRIGGAAMRTALGAWLCLAAAEADEICDLAPDQGIQGCIQKFDGRTVEVPANVVSITSNLRFCADTVGQEVTSVAPPSIVFLIDNSGSMSGPVYDAQERPTAVVDRTTKADPENARFTVVARLLDSIRAASPSAQVGLVMFSRRLSFEKRDNPLFQRLFADPSQHDSFVPLLPLDTTFANGVKGIDTLKAFLKHDQFGNLLYATRNPESRPNNDPHVDDFNVRDGTDISLGFEGAKKALQSAKAPRSNQFILFLSDGVPSWLDYGRWEHADDYRTEHPSPAEQANRPATPTTTPTTFTVFFELPGKAPGIPDNIQEMTRKIAGNGYSATNPKSAAYHVNLPAQELLGVMQNNVLTQILRFRPSPKGADVNGVKSAGVTDTSFLLQKRVPLTGESTPVTFKFTFSYQDPASGRAVPDSTFTYGFTVRRSASLAVPPAGLKTVCRDAGSLAFTQGGVPVAAIDAAQPRVEVKLTLPAPAACPGCAAQVSHAAGTDRLALPLSPAGAGFTGGFGREVGPAVAGDPVLQHQAVDTLLAEWVDPELPLHVLRARAPVALRLAASALRASYHDDDADGLVDRVRVRLSREPAPSVLADLPGKASLNPARGFRVTGALPLHSSQGPGLDLLVSQAPAARPNTAVDAADRLAWPADAPLEDGYLAAADLAVEDSLAPVAVEAEYRFEVQALSPGPVPGRADILRVTFSEAVLLPPAGRPFLLKAPAGPGYTLVAEPLVTAGREAGRELSFKVTAVEGASDPAKGDSLWLNPVPGILDAAAGRAQVHPGNRRVPLRVLPPPGQILARPYGSWSRPVRGGYFPGVRSWTLVGDPAAPVQPRQAAGDCCLIASPGLDTSAYIGIEVLASREFRVEVSVFSNLGEFVTRTGFEVPKEEFAKLKAGSRPGTRRLRLLWDGRSGDGRLAGTGAYVFRSKLQLLEAPEGRTDLWTLGILR